MILYQVKEMEALEVPLSIIAEMSFSRGDRNSKHLYGRPSIFSHRL